jgi:hypothetical protein
MAYAPQAWPSKIIDNWGDKVWVEIMNQEPEYINAWRGKAAGMTCYLYWFNSTLDFGFDIDGTPSEIAENIRYLYANGMRGIYHSCDTNFGFSGPTFYMMGKLMGDPYLDDRELVREYIDGVYGKAAPHMSKFFNALWSTHKERFPQSMHGRNLPRWAVTENIYLLFYPPETLSELEKHLKNAEAAADTEQAKGWVRLSRDYFDFTKLMVETIRSYKIYQKDKSDENRLKVKKSVDAFNEHRMKIVSYEIDYAYDWFPAHGHFCNWLSGNTQHESKVYYTPWEQRRPEILSKGVKGMAVGYGGGLAGQVSGYSYIREPLTLDW